MGKPTEVGRIAANLPEGVEHPVNLIHRAICLVSLIHEMHGDQLEGKFKEGLQILSRTILDLLEEAEFRIEEAVEGTTAVAGVAS